MKRIIKIGTLFFALMFNVCSVYSQEANKDVSIISSGSGKTLEDAKQAALRSATEQAFGAFISSKTEMFNDQVVSDQMASVSSGNIKSFEILNQDQLPDGRWGVTLKAIVSVDKLTSFVQAKGIAIEIKGGMFALNIKQQLLNEQGEIQAIAEMIGLLHEPMQISFDYVIKSSDPRSLDAGSKNWEIPLLITATCNKNIDFCANYFIKTLAALSLSPSEVETYKSLNKMVFPVIVAYKNQTLTYKLRKQSSISAIQSLMSNWEAYTRLFVVQSGKDESFGNGEGRLFDFSGSNSDWYGDNESSVKINFPSNGQQAANFSWNDNRTLAQIEQMTGFSVKPRGVVSNFKNGGYVVYEKDGHGLVMALFDEGNYNWTDARTAFDELVINGYNDWRCPSKKELENIYNNLYIMNFKCGIFSAFYWSYLESNDAYYFNFKNGRSERDFYNRTTRQVRGVRAY